METFFRRKTEINALYFAVYFVFLGFLSLSQEALPLCFKLHALSQALLEVSILLALSLVLKTSFFAMASFMLLLLHFVQFTITRVMDTGISYILKFFLGSGIEHMIVGFQALNLNWTMIGITAGAFMALPLAGLLFYKLTNRAFRILLTYGQIATALGVSFSLLVAFDTFAYFSFEPTVHAKHKRGLPYAATLLTPSPMKISLARKLLGPRDEAKAFQSLPNIAIEHKPNLYFFVIETLRKDFLIAAPRMSAFGKENIQIEESFSNAICTHCSWVSLFHSNLPFYWAHTRDHWTGGSIPLRYLKKLGYHTHVYSSADMRLFKIDQLLFGHDLELVDEMEEYATDRSIEPWQRDAKAMQALKENLAPSGHAYFIFLDSTHSEYSFPENQPVSYEPISKKIDYLTIGPNDPQLEKIKNRYRNAIGYIDQLLGQFFDTLKEKNLYDDAIVAITGDHGEEFFEEGALFHGTHLNRYQTSVPILFKFPSLEWRPQTQLATHIDLFPSILHYLTKQSDFSAICDGHSIFIPTKNRQRIAVLQDGIENPREFLMVQADVTLRARFLEGNQLELLQLEGDLKPNTFDSLLIP